MFSAFHGIILKAVLTSKQTREIRGTILTPVTMWSAFLRWRIWHRATWVFLQSRGACPCLIYYHSWNHGRMDTSLDRTGRHRLIEFLAQPVEQRPSEAQSSHFDELLFYAGYPADSPGCWWNMGSWMADYPIWVSLRDVSCISGNILGVRKHVVSSKMKERKSDMEAVFWICDATEMIWNTDVRLRGWACST